MHRRRRTCIEPLERRVLLAANAVPIQMIDGVPVATLDWQGKQVEVLAGRWVAKFEGYGGYLPDQASRAAQEIARSNRAFGVINHLGADGLFLVRAPQQMRAVEVLANLSRVPGFQSLQPDFRYELALTPNDPSFGSLWGLHNTGQSGGVVDADIDAPEAWNITTGSSEIVVGVVDSGIDYNHPDLNDNIWKNALEVPGNGIDDDGNGYIDDVYGWDWWSNDNNPADENNHGTHVAGTIGAEGNNGVGVAGINWNIKLMALKIGGSGPSVSGAAAVAAMNYVLGMKNRANQPVSVRVTNHSWGGNGFDDNMSNVIATHASNGILAIAAAGNNGSNNDNLPFYPAGYGWANQISVGNMTRNNVRNSGSNYGANSVHLFAPGTDILSTVRTNSGSYSSFTGTSMASPHVAGVAAMAFAASPGISAAQVRTAIFEGVDTFPAFTGISTTGGRLNAFKALSRIVNVPAAPSQPTLALFSDNGQHNDDNLTNDNTPTFVGVAPAGLGVRIYSDGNLVGSGAADGDGNWSVEVTTPLGDGIRSITARTVSGQIESDSSPARTITIDTVAPTVTGGLYNYFTSPQAVGITFSENVSWSIQNTDLELVNLTTSASVAINHTYNTLSNTASVTFPGVPVLPDGNYRLTALSSGPGGGIMDIAGNMLQPDQSYFFFFLMGDANHDGRVDLADFNRIAANFGQNLRDFSQGDFNYDFRVDLADFNILAGRFGNQLPGARTGLFAGEGSSMSSQTNLVPLRSELDEVLA